MKLKDILKTVLEWFKEVEKPVAVQGIVEATALAMRKAVKQCIKLQPELSEAEIVEKIMSEYDNGN